MKITVYSSIKNIPDFKAGVPILCYPSRQGNPHEAEFTFDVSEIHIMANQTGLWISKKLSWFDRLKLKLKRKKVI